ncbi:hypothetical protein N7456_010682 [Penicillium angulare]|uniref:Zn(2)-C6 fungal-type domain-containing protein n=1 Tax=Penicillium angulare TaxID=116970 RepID=A0A9W9F711_9EURO|nr:hypothetical protein N7456_010682 [Penicillium angulare]
MAPENRLKTRRPHTKSKNGCLTCKTRKVKCDESKPYCKNCERHGVHCEFDKPVSTGTLRLSSILETLQGRESNQLSKSITTSDAHIENFDDFLAGPAMGVVEMALLHHYSTSTCYTISRDPVLQTVWRIKVPKIGFQSPMVLRGILALSALHLAHNDPDSRFRYLEDAEYHHRLALQMASLKMRQINDEAAPAIYLFSIIASIISCARLQHPDDDGLFGDRDIEWLALIRGTWSVIASAQKSIMGSGLSPIFVNGNRRARAREARSTATVPVLDELRMFLKGSTLEESELNSCLDAVDSLSKSFATIFDLGSHDCQTADVFVWVLEISDHYLDLLRQRRFEAVVILGYFCVIVRNLEWTWWIQGLSNHLIQRIYYMLDEEYRCWLQWPMEQLGWAFSS